MVYGNKSFGTQEAWESLANAVCERAVRDFEAIISDAPLPDDVSMTICNLGELKNFAKEQVYTDLPLDKIMARINRVYKEEFRPYVKKNGKAIIDSWLGQKLDKVDPDKQRRLHPHVCPNCGGLLRPAKKNSGRDGYIVCTKCNLNMIFVDIPKKKKGGK
mgnify:CR=1 FL=1